MVREFGSSDDSDAAPVISRTRGKIWARGSQNDAAASHLNVALKRFSLNNRPASEFDNFYTPENRSFYSKSPYFKLDTTRHEVRLLKVYPEKKTYTQHMIDHPEWEGRDSSIYSQPRRTPVELAIERCESQGKATHPNLHSRVVPFNSPPEQSVIACELVDKIPLSRVDGKYHALSYCAGSPKNVSRILINGTFFNAFANLEHAIERTLYSWNSRNPGKELMLWVDQICINQDDQAERSSQVGLMRDIYRRSQDSLICLSTYSPYVQVVGPFNASACNGTFWMRYGLYPRGQTPIGSSPFENIDLFVQNKLQSNDNCALANLPVCFESLSIFLSCPWWSRAWVYQEFIMAPRAYFVYDSNTVSWAELSLVLEGVFKLKDKTVDDLASNISKLIKDKRNEEEEEKLKEEERMRQQATLKLAKQEPIRRDIQQLESRKSSLITIRDRARDIQSKRINLSSSDRKLAKEYLTYVQEVEDIKKKINSLNVRLKHHEVGILPGIANPRQSYLENLRKTLATLSTAQISIARVKELLPKLQSCMEPVVSLKKAKTQRRRVFELKDLLKHSRRCQASDPRDRIYAFLGLADKDYGVVPKYTCENTIVHILIDVAQKIVTIEGNLSILEHVREGREKLGTLLPSWVPDWTSNDSHLFTQEFRERIMQIRSQDGNNESFRASKDEISKPEFIKDQQNDCNLDIKVKAIFVEALDDIDGSLYDDSLIQTFLTPSGLRVHTSQVAAYDDEVWVLYGARSPVVLRPDQGGRYSFLSEALVCESNDSISDIMYGRMVDLVPNNEALVKVITIV